MNMVSVAQSVERRIVVPVAVGSIPITHPKPILVSNWAVSLAGRAGDS